MEIKRLLESGYIIIPDTNVLLNSYRYYTNRKGAV